MKYKGRQISGPNKKIIPILRREGNIFFVVQGVTDMMPFYSICPQPIPPVVQLPHGLTKANMDDKGYKDEIQRWWRKRTAWVILKSFESTEGLEFETVRMDDPSSYENWQKELTDSGFSDTEVGLLISASMEVNGLNEALMEEARQSFLITQAEQAKG